MDDGRFGAMIAERVREAFSSRRPLRIRGAGTWLDAGRPVQAPDTLSVADHAGIVEYVPGDLTLTARAGTRLVDIAAATRAHGQWLPLDPWGGDDGTIGATVSTGTAGPHSYAMGLPRDVVLGMEFVSGSGHVIRSGGRVVKNVAGFDLTRLLVGSWGTLGVITEVTVRLRARPEHTRTVSVAIRTAPSELNELATRARALPFTPLAFEVVNATLASRLGLGTQPTLLARIGGNAKAIAAQAELLHAFGEAQDVGEDVWDRLRGSEPASAATWRWSRLPSVFGDTWKAAEASARELEESLIHGNPARGVVRVVSRDVPAKLARAATAFAGTIAIESLPVASWRNVEPRTADDALSRAIRRKFDPAGILNTGILGEDA